MIGLYILCPLSLIVSALSVWSLYNAVMRGRVRSHGWIKRSEQPGFFWFVAIFTFLAAVWFGLVGIVISANLIGLA